ncbi:hypothetical protein ALQ08_03639 [Pseudomonas syringae pv. delphinii]|uniref:Uncharacterized protein n=1 Tax=Pseudomonas syringae pv. delphinii TaxID=192088 RepID=A0A0P9RBK3_9PSED|nr:hypothetical protein [Pseudomonas syringae group genomosp. 3]KPX25890.1 Uncharacterized protein ALO72_00983 [Pseudomonas syringae pv. delphinii]RMP06916.1 hypothetical protein ALQ28_00815 [Pseudomonas syringae pv. delphinii]RMP20117.1 hypothetical protein ALQ27_01091 [Pseudomonas syringae pv. delphinii]RMQ25139.1 hypothetical protein ALQ08_03639 [Pseudomonas syringae pv. delphinii]
MSNFQETALLKPVSIPKSRYKGSKAPLDAPDVAVAFHDEDTPGLIPVNALTQPLNVSLKVWPAALPDYTYRLVFDAKKVGPEKLILASHTPGDLLSLEVPTDLLSEGIHNIAYVIKNPENQVEETSNSFQIQIDKTPPGAPELAAIQFPVEIQNGLTAAELDRLGGQLVVQIAGYTGMAKHDLVQTRWGDIKGPDAIVNENDMGLDKVVVTFTREFLESLGQDEKLVCYKVVDRAGNTSILSNTVSVRLRLQEVPSDYPAPIVDAAVGSTVDYLEAQSGVAVDIPHYPGATALDNVQLFWGDNNPLAPVALPPGDEDETVAMTLIVPFAAIDKTPQGRVPIHYEVSRNGELVGTSLNTDIDVFTTLPVDEPLTRLTVQGTSVQNPNIENNFIDEDDYELNGRGLVSWNAGFQVNDDLNLHWGDQIRLQWRQINSDDVAAQQELIVPIDNNIIQSQGTGAAIPVYFTVSRAGNPNTVKSPIQPVTVRSREEQPGGQDGLAGPTFKLTPNGVLGPNENPDGSDVKILPYVNMIDGQRITFTFKGFDQSNNPIEAATYTSTRKVDEVDMLEGHVFTVPFYNTRIICTGFAEASYTVSPIEGSNQSPANSTVTRVPVLMLKPSDVTCLVR